MMRATHVVRFRLNRFCREVGKTLTRFLGLEVEDQCAALHFPFFAILHDISPLDDFSASIYRAGCPVYEVSYPCLISL